MPKGLDYDVAIQAGDIDVPARVVARWLRDPGRFGGKPIVQVAGNHEYYDAVLERELTEMRHQDPSVGRDCVLGAMRSIRLADM